MALTGTASSIVSLVIVMTMVEALESAATTTSVESKPIKATRLKAFDARILVSLITRG